MVEGGPTAGAHAGEEDTIGANKWRHAAELGAMTVEGQLHLVELLLHMHADLVAIREHLGIGRAECSPEEYSKASAALADGQPRR